MERTKVFISWSGAKALAVAKVWAELIGETFDTVDAFISDDIEPGLRGLDQIKEALDGTSFAIVVVTKDNEKAPWLNFEAGAISKQFPGNPIAKVAPCLVDFKSPAQLTTPLKQFQGELLNEQGVESILKSISTQAELSWPRKQRQFRRAWEDFYQAQFDAARSSSEDGIEDGNADDTVGDRSSESMIEEILEILRDSKRVPPKTARGSQTPSAPVKRIANVIYKSLESFRTTNVAKYSVGIERDRKSNTARVFVDIPGLDSDQRQRLGSNIGTLESVNSVMVSSDGDYLDLIESCEYKGSFDYPF